MSLPSSMLPVHDPAVAPAKKKRVLLVDSSRSKRDVRAETMRKLGIEVDCAADISEARCWWRAALYDLVLIHVEDAAGPVERFCSDIRGATPPQKIMFLAGAPPYLSTAPEHEAAAGMEDQDSVLLRDKKQAGANEEPQRWGIMEACKRISAVRSVCDARNKAIRNGPEPLRDSETSRVSRAVDAPANADVPVVEIIREELQ